ncbi:hypothetical protein GQ53DRAFT_765219 [Thozetella sp. PMI_491]|nr:hypothetical protein GQ53DRAFT_765219 [Thozetella sp. PMI_491]
MARRQAADTTKGSREGTRNNGEDNDRNGPPPKLELATSTEDTKPSSSGAWGSSWNTGNSWDFSSSKTKDAKNDEETVDLNPWGINRPKPKKKSKTSFSFGAFDEAEDKSGESKVAKEDDEWGGWGTSAKKDKKKGKVSVAEPVTEPQNVTDELWDTWGTSPKKKQGKNEVIVPDSEPKKDKKKKNKESVTEPDPEPQRVDDDDWGWGISSKKDRKKKGKAVTVAPDPEPSSEPRRELQNDDDPWESFSTSKKGKVKKKAMSTLWAIDSEPEPEPEKKEKEDDFWDFSTSKAKKKKTSSIWDIEPEPTVEPPVQHDAPQPEDEWFPGINKKKKKKKKSISWDMELEPAVEPPAKAATPQPEDDDWSTFQVKKKGKNGPIIDPEPESVPEVAEPAPRSDLSPEPERNVLDFWSVAPSKRASEKSRKANSMDKSSDANSTTAKIESEAKASQMRNSEPGREPQDHVSDDAEGPGKPECDRKLYTPAPDSAKVDSEIVSVHNNPDPDVFNPDVLAERFGARPTSSRVASPSVPDDAKEVQATGDDISPNSSKNQRGKIFSINNANQPSLVLQEGEGHEETEIVEPVERHQSEPQRQRTRKYSHSLRSTVDDASDSE